MIFAIAIGSSGEGEERYLVYTPFSLSPGRKISNIDLKHKFKVDEYEVKFEKPENYYALTFGPFATKELAIQYYPKIKSAFLWVSLNYMIGLSSPAELSDITIMGAPTLLPDAEPFRHIAEISNWKATDGYYDADKSVIRPDHKRLTRWEVGSVTLTLGFDAASFVQSINEAISFPYLENIQSERKLQLAIELYSSSFFEQSEEAKFIRLVTVMEALTPSYDVSESLGLIVNDVKDIVKTRRDEHATDSIEWEGLNQLLSRAAQLKKKSIGSSLRIYISSLIDDSPALGDKTEIVNKIRDIYDHRSKLLHDGIIDKEAMQENLKFLNSFVPKLLKLLYKVESTLNKKLPD